MEVVYIFKPGKKCSGIGKKVASQIQFLRANGVDCIAYFIGSGCPPLELDTRTQTVPIPSFNYPFKFLNKLRKELFIIELMRNQIALLTDHDILYMRIPYPSLFLSDLLHRQRQCKIVFEYQTIEPLEYRSMGKYWYLILDSLFGDAIRRYSDAIVGVTDEITNYELNRSGKSYKPHVTIGNGYHVESVPIRDPPIFSPDALDLLCVSNLRSWQGLDRFIRGLACYRGTTKVTFHIAGDGPELSSLKQMATELGVSDNVVFRGFMTGEALDNLYNRCHIAVGTLGIHRKGLTQGSTLKSREYFSRGIPYIISSLDPDVPNNCPYIFLIPPDDAPVSIEQIIEFARIVSRDRDHPNKMRTFAMERLDWSKKTCVLKRFFEMLVDNSQDQHLEISAVRNTEGSGDSPFYYEGSLEQ